MRIVLPFLLLLLGYLNLPAQPRTKMLPLIIRGQLYHSPERLLNISFTDENGIRVLDTIRLDEEGRFYLKTYKIKNPQLTSIWQKTTQINKIFVAPGYDLVITGDASDFKTLFKTAKIDGLGSESNQFRTQMNAALAQRMADKPWYQLDETELLAYAEKDRKFKDSLVHATFDRYLSSVRLKAGDQPKTWTVPHDPYLAYFRGMVLLDNQFTELYYLLNLAQQKKYSYAATKALVEDRTDHHLLQNMSKDDYLISDEYKTWIVGGEYTNYLLKLDYLKDSTLRKKKGYRLVKMDQVYTGKVKDYVLFRQMSDDITFAKNFDRLNYCKALFAPYIAQLQNKLYRTKLQELYTAKQTELLATAAGKPAPGFTLKSFTGTTHSLADYKGKVVFIDLWASWCGPCREQTPHLAALYERYKGDRRIQFISIAVSDGNKEWREAVGKDQPAWLQLIDKDDQVRQSYVANMIPQFIIVDKQGNIANFNAPEPGSGKALEDLLLAEMAKDK